ncbi:MAG: 4Fe-4S dicluster domain-containing protein [Promethearchaeota archaeon]
MNIKIEDLTRRVSGTGDFISIDNDICNNCERCLIICILNLWGKRDGKIYISDDYKLKCLECAACFQVCEVDAIKFNYPSGGTGIIFENG